MNTETNSVEDLRIEMDNQRPLGKVARRNQLIQPLSYSMESQRKTYLMKV